MDLAEGVKAGAAGLEREVNRQGGKLQTLQRGIEALSIIGNNPDGLSVAQLAQHLHVDRAIAYRIVATLEAEGLVSRTATGQLYLGSGILLLASKIEPQFQSFAQPLLRELANSVSATAFLSLARGEDAVAVQVAEPETGLIRVGYRVGSRHPLTLGAAGIAILAGRPEVPGDPAEVREARRLGYSVTRGQLQRGAVGVAAPVRPSHRTAILEASVGVVALDDLDVEGVIPSVLACAAELARLLHKPPPPT